MRLKRTADLKRETKNLVIRPLQALDYDRWKAASTTMLPKRNKWDRENKSSSEVTRQKFRLILKSQKTLRSQDKFYDLGVFNKKTGELIGTVSVMDVLRGMGQSAYIGYFINNTHWGLGFGKEATLALIDIAFRDIKVHRVEAGIDPTNRRSILLARSIGLRKEGLKKRAVFLRGKWNDLAMYSATCEEFNINWKSQATTRPR